MWNYLDIKDFHDRVRAILNANTFGMLTDEQIDMPEKAPLSETIIKSKVKNWEEYKENDVTKFSIFESCIIYQTAIYFEKYIKSKQPKRMQSSSINIEYSSDINETVDLSLRDMLESLLEQLSEEEETSSNKYFGFLVT